MDDEWADYAEGWDDDEAAQAYARAAFASLEAVLDDASVMLAGARVVDFGCGTGLLTERLVAAGAEVVAIDTSPAMLAVLGDKIGRHGWNTVTVADGLEDVTPGRDLIVASSVCSFLADYPATAARLAALLRPGGVFVQWDWERSEGEDHGLSRDEITAALVGAGLDQVTVDLAFEAEAHGQVMRPLVGHGRRAAKRVDPAGPISSVHVIDGARVVLDLGPDGDDDRRSGAPRVGTISADGASLVITGDDGRATAHLGATVGSIKVWGGSILTLSGSAEHLHLEVLDGARVDARLLQVGQLEVVLERCTVVAPGARSVSGWVSYGSTIEVGAEAEVDGLNTSNAGRIVRAD